RAEHIHLISDILKIMAPDLERDRIAVSARLDPDLPRPTASPDLIRQLLINLIRNAQDAMEARGGELLFQTTAATRRRDGQTEPLARIMITDTGCGIPPEHLSQVFDPFFTTKTPDKGTGLGLCVSYSIVRMYDGTIDLESEPGQGTTVIVALPTGGREARAGREASAEGSGAVGMEEAEKTGPG
ncbi:MAG: ATP-binding protein, partial [bacterium]|nr:ATP-binding protein [bacterium]